MGGCGRRKTGRDTQSEEEGQKVMEGETAEGDITIERRKVRGRGEGEKERGGGETKIERGYGGRKRERGDGEAEIAREEGGRKGRGK